MPEINQPSGTKGKDKFTPTLPSLPPSLPSLPPYLQRFFPFLLRHVGHAQNEPDLRHQGRDFDGCLEVDAGFLPLALSGGAEQRGLGVSV